MNWRELREAVEAESERFGVPLDDYEVCCADEDGWGETATEWVDVEVGRRRIVVGR